MKQTDQTAVFADLFRKTYTTDDERAAFERGLAKLVTRCRERRTPRNLTNPFCTAIVST
jgi:hypothetical protein